MSGIFKQCLILVFSYLIPAMVIKPKLEDSSKKTFINNLLSSRLPGTNFDECLELVELYTPPFSNILYFLGISDYIVMFLILYPYR